MYRMSVFHRLEHNIMNWFDSLHPQNIRDTDSTVLRLPPFVTYNRNNEFVFHDPSHSSHLRLTQDQKNTLSELIRSENEILLRTRAELRRVHRTRQRRSRGGKTKRRRK
jgi:hypothetical protein